MTAPWLQAADLSLRRGARTLLDGASLHVDPGEVVALLGPNGAGKSTLLGVLAGDLAPERGQATILGRPLSAWRGAELARYRAVVPQHAGLSAPFTVEEVVALGRLPHRGHASPAAQRRAVEAALDALDLGVRRHQPWTTLSGGERQRVQLARALAQLDHGELRPPRLLLLDEPTASLDPASARHLLAVALHHARAGVAALVVLHDINLAAQVADRLVVLHHGRVVADGAPRDVLQPPLLEQVYGLRDATLTTHPRTARPVVLFA